MASFTALLAGAVGEASTGHALAETALFEEILFQAAELLVNEVGDVIDDFGFVKRVKGLIISARGKNRMGGMGVRGGMFFIARIIRIIPIVLHDGKGHPSSTARPLMTSKCFTGFDSYLRHRNSRG